MYILTGKAQGAPITPKISPRPPAQSYKVQIQAVASLGLVISLRRNFIDSSLLKKEQTHIELTRSVLRKKNQLAV
jgi:hypothetical protein